MEDIDVDGKILLKWNFWNSKIWASRGDKSEDAGQYELTDTSLHGATSQRTAIFIVTALRTSSRIKKNSVPRSYSPF
jgi:hypothetical protein